MPSYLITGAGRGIGFGFLDYLSRDADKIVIGIVRNKATTDAKVAKELVGRTNIHIIQGDMTDHKSLKNAVETTASITGGSLDVLIANANFTRSLPPCDPLDELANGGDDDTLQAELLRAFNINVVGNVYLTNFLLPLIRKGTLKRMVYISTGLADLDLTVQYDLYEQGPYSISKAALNMMVAKYHAKHHEEGILFMAVSPGVVDSGVTFPSSNESHEAKMGMMAGKFMRYAPHFRGPITVEESVEKVLTVVDHATLEHNGGQMVSHLGNKAWI